MCGKQNSETPEFRHFLKGIGGVLLPVTNEERERLLQLCEEAAKEQDAERLLAMIQEINELLETKKDRLKQRGSTTNKLPD